MNKEAISFYGGGAMWDQVEDLPPAFWVTSFLIYVGSLLQVGYFSAIGSEFLYMTSASDWALTLIIIAGPLIGFAFVVAEIAKGMAWALTRVFGSPLASFIEAMPTWSLVISSALFGMVFLRNSESSLYWQAAYGLFLLGWTAVVWSLVQEGYSDMVEHYLALAIGWGLFSFCVGSFYGAVGGRICTISFNDNRQLKAVYMRSVSDGHLIRLNGSTYFLSKPSVSEIKCPWYGNSLVERLKLLKVQK